MLLSFADYPADDTIDPFAARNTDLLDPELVKGLRWVWAARGLVERAKSEQASDATALIAQFPKWVPPRKAWQQITQDLLHGLRLQQDLELMIHEWAGDARPPMRITLSSRIATQPKGRDLTEAYICSQQANHRAAYLLTDAIEQGLPSGLVLDLALLLKNVIRVRNQLAFQAPAAPVHRNCRALQTLWVAVKLVPSEEKAMIQAILPRRTQLCRKMIGRGGTEHILATNIDTAFLVTAADSSLWNGSCATPCPSSSSSPRPTK
jgi:hypothetical protein